MVFVLLAARARAGNLLIPGAVVSDPPTVVTLGVHLPVSGDDNGNATVSLRYRALGEVDWHDGLPLIRTASGAADTTHYFAGSIFDLAPDTEYEIELRLADPDGAVGGPIYTTAKTRRVPPAEPADPEPVTVTTAAGLRDALRSAGPGRVINLVDVPYGDGVPQESTDRDTLFSLTASGTCDDPIVLRGVGDASMLDGLGCPTCTILSIRGSHIHVENLRISNAGTGIGIRRNKMADPYPRDVVVRRVHVDNADNGILAGSLHYDSYICDNLLEGRLLWSHVYGDDAGDKSLQELRRSYVGIGVRGTGNVVCHNRIVGFGDAMRASFMDALEYARADDFYGNDVRSAYDDGLEFDYSTGNVRAFRNRFLNAWDAMSFQPLAGGPAYVLRNVIVNVIHEELKFRDGDTVPSGPVWALHNTVVRNSPAVLQADAGTVSGFIAKNNVFIGSAGGALVVDWQGPLADDVLFDWNGWFPDGRFEFGPGLTYQRFHAMQTGGRFERHGVLLDTPPFPSGLAAGLILSPTADVPDAGLDPTCGAVDGCPPDRDCLLPNVNDRFIGNGPDFGALEVGCPASLYGERPAGVDERNELLGCECAGKPAGAACTDDGNPCTLDACDATSGVCQHPAGNAGAVCRPAAGACDVAETCTGTSTICPADGFQPTTTVCRSAAGACDASEHCGGTGVACPADVLQPSGTVCRSAAGICDVAELCDGTTVSCPADHFASSTTTCRASAGVCDPPENCPGDVADCPADASAASGTICRSATGGCDVAEECNGTDPTCPPDGFEPTTVVCRDAAGVCDVAEHCPGDGPNCPADAFQASTVVCRASAGGCDIAESCTGSGVACPADVFQSSSTVCRAAAGACDVAEVCNGTSSSCPADDVRPSGFVCRTSAGPCDPQEVCDGSSAACPLDAESPSGAVCRAATDPCRLPDRCTGTASTCPEADQVKTGCDAITCAFERSIAPPECADEPVPGAVARLFQRAGGITAQPCPAKRRRCLAATRQLHDALAVVHRAARRRKHPISASCTKALEGVVAGALHGLNC